MFHLAIERSYTRVGLVGLAFTLVFGTIAAESQRLINETYSTFVQGFMPALPRPDVDHMEGLTPAIIVDQERMGANSRSTVSTGTGASGLMRRTERAIPAAGGPGWTGHRATGIARRRARASRDPEGRG